MALVATLSIGLLLAYANGANDNFKGVATLFGSGVASYRTALIFATGATVLGSLAAFFLAGALLEAFTGSGLVAPELAAEPRFGLAVAAAAGTTVLFATRLSFPVSTTHALTGALVGVGLFSSPQGIDSGTLTDRFVLPLLLSPVLAVVLAVCAYPLCNGVRRRLGIEHETCVCVGDEVIGVLAGDVAPGRAIAAMRVPTLAVDDIQRCRIRYRGAIAGVSVRRLLTIAHALTAGLVSFARGLNDTPKIAALLLVGHLVAPGQAIAGVAAAIAVGGWLSARRVAETMAHRITGMNPGQGFLANVVTAGLVIGASNFGLPVSTTHVSCGSLFGIGIVTGQAHARTIGEILLAWVVTLPLAAILGVGFAIMLGRIA